MSELDVFPGLTADDLVGDLFRFPIPTVAGGEPGIIPELDDIFDFSKRAVFDPVSTYLTGKIKDLIRDMVSAVSGFFSIAGWWVYRLTWNVSPWRRELWWLFKFPDPDNVKGLSPWYYLHKIARMLLVLIEKAVEDLINWLWSNVSRALNNVYGLVTDSANWLWKVVTDRVGDVFGWVRDHAIWLSGVVSAGFGNVFGWVRDHARWLWDNVSTGIANVFGWVRDHARWLWDNVSTAFEGLRGFIQNVVIQGGENLVAGIRDAFDFVFGKVIDALGFLGDQIAGAWKAIWETILAPFIDLFERKLAIPGRVLRGDYPRVQDFIEDLMDPPRNVFEGVQLFVFALIVIIPSLIVGFIPAFSPLNEKWAATIWQEIGGQVLPATETLQAWNRDLIDEGTATQQLQRQGYSGAELNALKQLRFVRPGVSDLVRFAVREVFTPEIAERFGAYQDLPGRFVEEARLNGLDEEIASWFWAAHWDLPSTTQGFEMLHRNVIDRPDLDLLLRAQDVQPFWRDKLVAIAYSPFTRVDVRRMYDVGVLDRAGVKRAYLDLGFDDEKAEDMTEFTIAWVDGSDDSTLDKVREATQAQTIASYKRGLITRAEALEMLLDLRYTEQAADLILAIADFDLARNPYDESDVDVRELTRSLITEAYREGVWDRAKAQAELEAQGYLPLSADLLLQLEDVAVERDLTRAQIHQVETLYKGGHIDRSEAQRQLLNIDLPEDRARLKLRQWDVEIGTPSKELTLAQLQRALKADMITEEEFLTELFYKGYSDRDAALLLALT